MVVYFHSEQKFLIVANRDMVVLLDLSMYFWIRVPTYHAYFILALKIYWGLPCAAKVIKQVYKNQSLELLSNLMNHWTLLWPIYIFKNLWCFLVVVCISSLIEDASMLGLMGISSFKQLRLCLEGIPLNFNITCL